MKIKKTIRGFDLIEFKDNYGVKCSLQKSSAATDDYIWLGVDEPEIKEFWEQGIPADKNLTCKWEDRPLESLKQCETNSMHIFSRMHLNRKKVKELLPYLQKFVETGNL